MLLCPLFLKGEPANVLVGKYTFTRPETWIWADPPKVSSATSRFVIHNSSGKPTQTDVRFYVMKKEVQSERDNLLHQFPGTSTRDLQEESFKIGNQKIIYLRIEGTYQFRTSPPRHDQIWLGAAIPVGKEFVYARILGPRGEVEQYMPTFRKMVEEAVKEYSLN